MALNEADKAIIEDRRSKAWELRLKGKSTRQIALALEVSVGTAHSDLAAVMERTKEENDDRAETHRALSLARLDRALDTIEAALGANSLGEDDAAEDLGADHELRLKALDRLLKIEERRAKLLGLDAPTKVDANVTTVGLDEIDELRNSANANSDECSPKDPLSSSEPGE
jgi:DNA-binding CsgD family transcriptional regulator